ncbi:MAG: hypothetical protein ACFBSC_13435 [Microcoleaceae cyanobacterium]
MFSWPIDPAVYALLIFLHCLLGGIAALVAKQRGYNFKLWLLLGLFGGTAALVVSFTLKPQKLEVEEEISTS